MARRGRPASETFQPVCYSSSHLVSLSSEAVELEDEDDHSPIFSLSKSSMDVVMAPGSPLKRDPAWTRMDLRRSHSTNTHSEPNPVTHKKLHDRQSSLTGQNVDVHSPAGLGERWISNRQRWSQCSSSPHSRSSTPETIVWKDRTSRPSSLTTETINSPVTDSPTSQPTSSPTDTSTVISPLQTPTSPPEDFLTSTFTNLIPQQQNDMSSPSLSPLLSPLQAHASSPMTSTCPTLPQFTSTEEEGFLENNLLSFTFPSPLQSSVSLADRGAEADHGCLADDVIEDGGARSPVQMFSYMTLNSPTKKQESGASVCKLELLRQPGQVCPTGRRWRSLLVSSMSDSQLGDCWRCSLNTREDFTKVEAFKEEATMTSQLELVDAATQTISPVGSCWHLVRNMSTSNMGSPSILGSPPGSRLNLKSLMGSHSNLVSPSSSMFPVSSGEEEERPGDDQTGSSSSLLTSSHGMQRRRSCLKIQKEESDELWRRSSMKQVQWDENGMTWDIHGASVDPEVLSTAIRKHLEDHNSPQPARRSSKKKKAPKPPLKANVVTAIAPELGPSVAITLSTCMMEGESEDTPDGFRELGGVGGDKKEETVESAGRKSRAEEGEAKAEEEEVHRGEGATDPRSPSRGSGQGRKKSMIRSLRRPGWCGGSKKAYD